jgi:hypothetical protein
MVADYQGVEDQWGVTQSVEFGFGPPLADLRIQVRLTDLGGVVLPGSPADYGMLVAGEIEKWGEAVFFGARPD